LTILPSEEPPSNDGTVFDPVPALIFDQELTLIRIFLPKDYENFNVVYLRLLILCIPEGVIAP
jgi:hypothetical protein